MKIDENNDNNYVYNKIILQEVLMLRTSTAFFCLKKYQPYKICNLISKKIFTWEFFLCNEMNLERNDNVKTQIDAPFLHDYIHSYMSFHAMPYITLCIATSKCLLIFTLPVPAMQKYVGIELGSSIFGMIRVKFLPKKGNHAPFSIAHGQGIRGRATCIRHATQTPNSHSSLSAARFRAYAHSGAQPCSSKLMRETYT